MAESRNIIKEPIPDYEKAEADLLKEGLTRSFNERFHMMATLMKMGIMFKQADIKHQSLPAKKK